MTSPENTPPDKKPLIRIEGRSKDPSAPGESARLGWMHSIFRKPKAFLRKLVGLSDDVIHVHKEQGMADVRLKDMEAAFVAKKIVGASAEIDRVIQNKVVFVNEEIGRIFCSPGPFIMKELQLANLAEANPHIRAQVHRVIGIMRTLADECDTKIFLELQAHDMAGGLPSEEEELDEGDELEE